MMASATGGMTFTWRENHKPWPELTSSPPHLAPTQEEPTATSREEAALTEKLKV